MATEILSAISNFIIHTISDGGYWGVIGLMAIESANIPLPSEVIMPFAGFSVSQGHLTLWGVALAGGIGCTIGSAFSWWLGYIGGRPLVERYGKYVLLSHHDLDIGEKWFVKYGSSVAFFSRLLPFVRTFISFPAGISKVPLFKFLAYTFIGSVIWSYLLAYLGQEAGQNWEFLKTYFHKFDFLILLLIIAAIVWWIWKHFKTNNK